MNLWLTLVCVSSGWMNTAAAATPTPPSEPATPTGDQSAQLLDWLIQYGYLPPPDPSTGQLQAWTAVTGAIRAMQRFAGLKDSGVVDEETMALMKSPRCSLPDQDGASLRRKRRAASMWSRRNINWRLRSYPSSAHLSREMIRSLVFYALRVWAEPTPLEFHEVGSPEAADLQVDFLRGSHGDGYPFDGAGGAVGHAFFPSDPSRAGGVHLDAEELWVFRQPALEGTDLFTVLVHEFGHALGLAHSSSRHSVMRPYYQGPVGDPLHYRLGQRDLERITQLYGRRNQLTPTEAPRLTPEPRLRHRAHHHHHLHRHSHSVDRCNTTFDAVAKIRGETFFFKGLTVWRVNGGGLVSGRGASVRRLWRGLPPDLPHLDAVLERHSDHAIIFISGSWFWLFRDLSLQDGYPQPLTALQLGLHRSGVTQNSTEVVTTGPDEWGLVWDPEDGPVWGRRLEGGPDEGVWTQLLKRGVSGITRDNDGSVYVFKGDSYWKFPAPGSAAQPGYPRSSAVDWLGCSEALSPSSVDDFSLSMSPPAGQQELWGSSKESEGDVARRREARPGQKHPHREDSESDRWTLCTCQSRAAGGSRTPATSVLLLLTWTLSAAVL